MATLPCPGVYTVFFDGYIGPNYFKCPDEFRFILKPVDVSGDVLVSSEPLLVDLPIREGKSGAHPSEIDGELRLGKLKIPWTYGASVSASWTTHDHVQFEMRNIIFRFVRPLGDVGAHCRCSAQ